MNNIWKTLKKVKEYSNPYMDIWRNEVVRSNGLNRPYYVIDKSKDGKFSICIPLTENLETYLVGQYRYPVSAYSWEFPMGRAVGGNFLHVAKTELLEEIGIKAKTWIEIGHYYPGPGMFNDIATIFLAKKLSFHQNKPEETEILEIKKIPITEVGKMIEKGIILDGPTIVAYHYFEIYSQQEEVK